MPPGKGFNTDMLKFISNYPISRRLFIAFALAAVLPSIIIALMGFYYVGQVSSRGNASQVISTAQDSTNNLSINLQDMYTRTKSMETLVLSSLVDTNAQPALLTTVASDQTLINNDKLEFSNDLSTYQAQFDPVNSPNMSGVADAVNRSGDSAKANDESSLLHDAVSNAWPKYSDAQQTELTDLQNIAKANYQTTNQIDDAVTKITLDSGTLDTAYQSVGLDWSQLTNDVTKISNDINVTDATDTEPIVLSTIGAFLLTLLTVIFLGFAVQGSITRPLSELVSLTKRISKGDTNARAKVSSQDEIAIVANAMNNMLDNIVHLIQDTQSQRDVLQGQVEKLVSEVSGVGEGDLRVQAEVTADALGVLADSFNYMVEELGSLVVRVKMVAREVEESTTMTSDRMGELVEVADRQIQQIASAAIEIERMAQTSQQVAGRAQALASSAREARISAQGGRQAVQQTVEGMERIHSNVQETSLKVQTLGERSREINNIVEAISNIAHQTNRLALDAAIQAAMAGDNGKGFGAVAADIRRLAERAKEQASSVGRIVRSVRDDIGAVAVSMRDTERETSAGAQLAEEAGTSLESIFAVVERQAREIEIINQMATQQQQSSNEVVQIMQGVSESTQDSSTSTREAAQNMERMARLAEQLLSSVEAFKLRETLNYFAPSSNLSDLSSGNVDNPLSVSGIFRTVSATAQPASLPGNYNALPGPVNTFPPYLPSPSFQQENGFIPGPPFQQDNGFAPVAPYQPESNGSFGAQGNGQQPWPTPNDWQAGNWQQTDWK